jgi:hypothetical protein
VTLPPGGQAASAMPCDGSRRAERRRQNEPRTLTLICVLSKGRMRLLTVGLGTLPGKAEAMGADFTARGRRSRTGSSCQLAISHQCRHHRPHRSKRLRHNGPSTRLRHWPYTSPVPGNRSGLLIHQW